MINPWSGLMQQRFKFEHVNEITGTFVLLVLTALIAAVVWTGRSQHWFRGNVTLRIILPATGAAGIREGSEVYFLGTLVGTVSEVSVDRAGRMAARVNIRRDFFPFVRTDSSAVVKKKMSIVGDAYFEITRGHGQPLPEKNASIICHEPLPGTLETLEEVRREAMPALKKLSAGLDVSIHLGTDLDDTRQQLNQLILRLDSIAAAVQQGQGIAGKLVTDTALADDTQQLLARANEAMGELQGVATNLNAALRNVQNGTARLPEITESVANGVKDLPGLIQQMQVSMREMERTMEAMQRHWLLRKYVNTTNPPPRQPMPGSQPPQKTPVNVQRSPKDSAK